MINAAEMVFDAPMSERGRRYFSALHKAAPDWVYRSAEYSGRYRTIILYGAGHPNRGRYMQDHLAKGGRAIVFDLAYFDRYDSLRVSVDGLHPTAEHLQLSDGRPPRRQFELRYDRDTCGHIVLVGLGRKSVAGLNVRTHEWEHQAYERAKQIFPGAKIIWRPKKGDTLQFLNLPAITSETPIVNVLSGARAVFCRHSNVAVDACLAGVPVFCEGGAAYALYRDNPNPEPSERRQFLNRLSWWEWSIHEAPALWNWIQYILTTTDQKRHEN
jgi:hypothetical protein